MGIKFPCAHCGQRLNIKSDLAGKRGICPHCHAKIDIPTESVPRVKSPTTWAKAPTHVSPGGAAKDPGIEDSDESTFGPSTMRVIPSVAAAVEVATEGSTTSAAKSEPTVPASKFADPIEEAPKLRWYVMPEGATQQYGPAPGDVMRGWLADGRVGVDSLVWREDWPDWLEAAKVFPQLVKAVAPQVATPPVTSAPAVSPALGGQKPEVGTQRPEVAKQVAPAVSVTIPAPQAPVAAPGPQIASLIKVDEPVRHLAPAHAYVPASKRPKTASLIVIVLLVLAMLILTPIVIYVLTRQ